MRDSDVDRRAVDATLVVDHKIAFTVADDVDQSAYLTLKVLQLIAAGIEVDHSYGFLGISGDNEGIHVSG